MIKWCIYCHRFLGEVARFEDYKTTFGICPRCYEELTTVKKSEDFVARTHAYEKLNHLIKQTAASGNLLLAKEVIEIGTNLGMTPLDLFLGIVQPILYEVGTRWDKGELSIVQEHQFTAFFERLFHLIYTSEENENLALRQSNQPTVLLVNAPGNFHTLGIRIVELWLISKQISCYTVYPGIPVPDIIALVASLKPVVLGISVSLPEQFNSLFELEDKLWKTPGIHPISMIVGGYAVKTRSRKEQTLLRAKLVSDLDSFLMEVTQAIDLKRESKARAG